MKIFTITRDDDWEIKRLKLQLAEERAYSRKLELKLERLKKIINSI